MAPKLVSPKVKFLVKSESQTKPISTTMKWLFIIFHVVFALDFGFTQNQFPELKFRKWLTLAHASSIIAILIYLFFYAYPHPYSPWYFVDALIYYSFVFIILFSKNTFFDFQYDLHVFDGEIKVDSNSYKVERKIFFLFFMIFIFRIFISALYCLYYLDYCNFPTHVLCVYYIVMLGHYVVTLMYAFVFQSVYYRMRSFTSFMKDENTDIVSCHYLYKSIVEITEKMKKTFDLVLVLSLVITTTNVIVTIYVPVATQLSDNALNPLAYVVVVHEMLMMFSPAITAGLLSSQVDSLKLVLYDRLVKDQKHTKDIERFISYIDTRPLRFKVWMVIPLDWSLPVIVVNITVTYLIVMIQFTHNN